MVVGMRRLGDAKETDVNADVGGGWVYRVKV
jgi:hypothetical protein